MDMSYCLPRAKGAFLIMRKRYTDDFRASAVIMLEAEGYPQKLGALTSVAQYLKVPLTTLHRWFHAKNNPPPSELVTIKKEDLARLFLEEVYHAVLEMGKARQDADYRELATAIGILTDKLQLLTGEPTERTAVVNELSDVERASRIVAILERGRQERARQPSTDILH